MERFNIVEFVNCEDKINYCRTHIMGSIDWKKVRLIPLTDDFIKTFCEFLNEDDLIEFQQLSEYMISKLMHNHREVFKYQKLSEKFIESIIHDLSRSDIETIFVFQELSDEFIKAYNPNGDYFNRPDFIYSKEAYYIKYNGVYMGFNPDEVISWNDFLKNVHEPKLVHEVYKIIERKAVQFRISDFRKHKNKIEYCKRKTGINWSQVSGYEYLEEEFMEYFKDEIDWNRISVHQNLSTKFMEKHIDRLNMFYVCKYQKLDDYFITKFSNKLNWKNVKKYQKLSDEMKNIFKEKLDEA